MKPESRRVSGRNKCVFLLLLLCFLCVCAGCRTEKETERNMEAEAGQEEEKPTGEYVEKEALTETGPIYDNDDLYAEDDETSVVTMYLTICQGNEGDNTNHTWEEINSYSAYYYEENDLDRYNVDAILQIGDESGPLEGEFGYGETIPNAAVQVRGQTSSRSEQKNYKVRIKDGKGEWRGQRTLALNKHVSDPCRFTNKLAYDLMKAIPQMMSARTQFVHLYVKDESEGVSGEFQDYGLYTQVEQINKTYLKNHGLDSKGQLYKINFFEWDTYDAVMKLKTDEDYDEDEFEYYIEIKGNDDHSKIQEVLRKLNDYSVPIEEIIEQYFDPENICYWMAFHILTGNYDVGARNAYIYSPLNSEKWYFISWDNDDSFRRTWMNINSYVVGQSWEQGLTQFVALKLCNRMFREEKYRDILDAAIEDLKNHYLTREIVEQKINAYSAVVKPYVFSQPDIEKARVDEETYDIIVAAMPDEIETNYRYYKESLEKPWPFYVGLPEKTDDGLRITWDVSYDIDDEDITYSFILASDYEFQNVIAEETDIRIPQVTVGDLPEGQYFIRVRAKNESGYEQDCFDSYSVSEIGKVYGARSFYIDETGDILEYVENDSEAEEAVDEEEVQE